MNLRSSGAWLAALICSASAGYAADLAVPANTAATSSDQQWQAVFNTDVRYFTFNGSRAFPAPNNAAQLALPVRGSGSQVYVPMALQLVGTPLPDLKVEATIRSGYVSSEQTSRGGFSGSFSTTTDTVLAVTATYLGLQGVQPFVSLNINAPSGTAALFGLTRPNARLDPDLVDIPAFGSGFNVGPTLGVNIPINRNLTFTFGVGYTSIGPFDREGAISPVTGAQGIVSTDPGDSYSANASVGYQDGAFAATLAGVYSRNSATKTNFIRTFRGGDSFTLTGNLSYLFFEALTATLTGSLTHTEANAVANPVIGNLAGEAPNSNSNVFRIGLDTIYRFTPAFGVGPTVSYLYRDRNALLPSDLQFVPAKTRYSAGGVLQYAFTDTTSLNARFEHIWTRESSRQDQQFFGFVFPDTGTSKLSFDGWALSAGVNVQF